MAKVKSINALMKYMRENHNIEINGSSHKNKLSSLGYYHGFKGYRFIRDKQMPIQFKNFNEVIAINKLDMDLKALIYPKIMFIEMAIKNYTLEKILDNCGKSDFNSVYETLLTAYNEQQNNQKDFKKKLANRLRLRDQIHTSMTREFNKSKSVIEHFYIKERHVPIWAIFEIITMGELGNFIACLKKDVREQISKEIKLNMSVDSNSELLHNIIFLLKDLRNSVAHNNIIFDARFKTGKVSKNIALAIEYDMNIKCSNSTKIFENILDYIILIIYILKGLKVTKTELNRFITDFESIIEEFRKSIDISIYNKIFGSNVRNKINELKIYIKK